MRSYGIPIWFKLWFGVIAVMAVSGIGASVYVAYQIVSDPRAALREVGAAAGEAMKGYEEARK